MQRKNELPPGFANADVPGSADDVTVRDLAELFILSGSAGYIAAADLTERHKLATEIVAAAKTLTEVWLARRTKNVREVTGETL